MHPKIDKENTPVESMAEEAAAFAAGKSQSMPSLPVKRFEGSRRPRKALSRVNLNQPKELSFFSRSDLPGSREALAPLSRKDGSAKGRVALVPSASSETESGSSFLESGSPLMATTLGDPLRIGPTATIRSSLVTPQQPGRLDGQSDSTENINTQLALPQPVLPLPVSVNMLSACIGESEALHARISKDSAKQAQPDPLCLQLANKYHLGNILKSRPWIYQSIDAFYSHLESEGMLAGQALLMLTIVFLGLLKMDLLLELTKYRKFAAINLSPSFAVRSSAELPFLKTSSLDASALLSITKPFYHHAKAFSPSLKALDLTNIPLDDESIRYLIRLDGLEALGLSGTALTTQGVKYLATHAAFKPTLRCLKLCFAEHLSDDCLSYICQFSRLTELDLWGTKLRLEALLTLVDCQGSTAVSRLPLKSLRVNDAAFSALLSHHASYQFRHSPALLPMVQLVQEPGQVASLSRADIVEQLKVHQLFYPDIFLNLKTEELAAKLEQVLVARLKEEKLWSLL